MKTDSRQTWIDRFVEHAVGMEARSVPSASIKVAEQLWYSFHDEDAADIATLWVRRALPQVLMRDAWTAACSHRLCYFNQQMARDDAETMAQVLFELDPVNPIDPCAAAEAWWATRHAPVA